MVLVSAPVGARPERNDGGHPALCNAPLQWLRIRHQSYQKTSRGYGTATGDRSPYIIEADCNDSGPKSPKIQPPLPAPNSSPGHSLAPKPPSATQAQEATAALVQPAGTVEPPAPRFRGNKSKRPSKNKTSRHFRHAERIRLCPLLLPYSNTPPNTTTIRS